MGKCNSDQSTLSRNYTLDSSCSSSTGFYDEISSTMLQNLTFVYPNSSIEEDSLTTTTFSKVFKGTETLVCGRIIPEEFILSRLTGVIRAETREGPVNIVLDNTTKDIMLAPVPEENSYFKMPVDFAAVAEKTWAYMTIKNLLKERRKDTYRKQDSTVDKKILELSLKVSRE